MESRKLKISRSSKQLIIAASAVVTMGVGTSLKHQLVVEADATNTSSTVSAKTDTSSAKVSNAQPESTDDSSSNIQSNSSEPVPTVQNGSVITESAGTSDVDSSKPTDLSESKPDLAPSVAEQGVVGSATPVALSATPNPTADETDANSTGELNDADTLAPASVDKITPSAIASTADDFYWNTDDTNSTATVKQLKGDDYTEINIPSKVNLNNKDYDVTGIGDSAFIGNNNITSVTINDGLQTIGTGAFGYMSNLTTVDMSKNTTLTTIGDQAFAMSTSISAINIPNSVKTIGNAAFKSTKIMNVDIPNSVTNIGNEAFGYDSSLTSVHLGNSVLNIGNSAFASSNITTIYIPDSVRTIGDSAFYSNALLESVSLGSGLVSIGNHAFQYDSGITKLDMSRASNLSTIGDGAFQFASIPGSLIFPESLTSIGTQAFSDNKLESITINGNNTEVKDAAFENNHITNIIAPQIVMAGNPVVKQTAEITIDSTKNTINNFFNVKANGFTEENINIGTPTNNVKYTYNNGVGTFNIPAGTQSFTFDWTMGDGYTGTYKVTVINPIINVTGSHIYTGSSWSPEDNFDSAYFSDKTPINFDDVSVEIKDPNNKIVDKIDTSIPGIYSVKYTYGNESVTADVEVSPSKASLAGSDYTMYIGDPVPSASSFKASATNNGGETEPVQVDLSKANYKVAGDYNVELSAEDNQTKTVVLHVLARSTGGGSSHDSDNSDNTVPPTKPSNPSVPDDSDTTDPSDPVVPGDSETSDKPDQSPDPDANESTNVSDDTDVDKNSESVIELQPDNDDNNSSIFNEDNTNNTVVLSNNTQVSLPSLKNNNSNVIESSYAQTGRLPQTGSSNGLLASLAGTVIAMVSLLGIDIKSKKI